MINVTRTSREIGNMNMESSPVNTYIKITYTIRNPFQCLFFRGVGRGVGFGVDELLTKAFQGPVTTRK